MKLPISKTRKRPKPVQDSTTADVPTPDPSTLIRFSELKKILPWSRTTCWRAIREKRFPAPLKLGRNLNAWRKSEIVAWIDKRANQRDQS